MLGKEGYQGLGVPGAALGEGGQKRYDAEGNRGWALDPRYEY